MLNLNDSANSPVKGLLRCPARVCFLLSPSFRRLQSISSPSLIQYSSPCLSPPPGKLQFAAFSFPLLSLTTGMLALKSWRGAHGFGTAPFFPCLMTSFPHRLGALPPHPAPPSQAQNPAPPGSQALLAAASQQSPGARGLAGKFLVDVNQGCVGTWIPTGFREDVRGSDSSLASQAGWAGGEEPACAQQRLVES